MVKGFLSVACALFISLECSTLSVSKKEMTLGERLFRANCRACHTLPNPKSHSDGEWNDFINRHKDRIQLQEDELASIVHYLQNANLDSLKEIQR